MLCIKGEYKKGPCSKMSFITSLCLTGPMFYVVFEITEEREKEAERVGRRDMQQKQVET